MAKRGTQKPESIWRRWAQRFRSGSATAEPRSTRRKALRDERRRLDRKAVDENTALNPDAELAAFEEDLRGIAAAQASIRAGRLQLLNVAHVVEHFGPKWPKVVDRVHGIIERVLRKHLDTHDIFRRHRELFYIVVFSDIGGDEARARMALIGGDINKMLFGDEAELASLELRSAVFDVDGKIILESYAATEVLGRYAEQAAGALVAPEKSAASSDDPPVEQTAAGPVSELAPPVRENAKLKEVERAHKMIQARLEHIQITSTRDENQHVEYRMLHDLEDELLRLHDRLARRVPLVEREEPERLKTDADVVDEENRYPRPATLLLMEAENAFMANDHERRHFNSDEDNLQLTFAYRPVWHVDAKIIGTYFVTAFFKEGEVVKTAERAFRNRINDDVNALIDRCLLRRALLDLTATDRSATSIIAVPIHYATLRHLSHRRTLQYLLHGIPNWCREYLAWEVLDAPPDALRTHIEEAASVLRPFGRTIIWRTSFKDANLKSLSITTVNFASVALGGANREEMQSIDGMNEWCSAAEKGKLKTYLRGADTRSLAVAAVCAGFDRIAGDAIGGRVDTFKGVMPFTTEQMYMNLVSEAFDRQ